MPALWQMSRHVSVRSEDENECLHGFRKGTVTPRVVPFQISLHQAQLAFEQWQQSHWLAPSKLLRRGLISMHAALLPFWLFEATVHVEYTGQLGFPVDHKSMVWKDTHWRVRGFREYPWTLSSMQVYASYKYRRDLADAAKVAGIMGRSRQLRRSEAEHLLADEVGWGDGGEADVALDSPTVRQAIGWSFALRNIRRLEAEEAAEQLRRETGAESVRDVKVRVRTVRRRARLLYLPAYVADYKFGEAFNAHGERRPQRFKAVVSGLDASRIAAERHFSPHKVQAAAAGAMALVGLAAGAVELANNGSPQLLSATSAFSVFMVCSAAGLAARMSTQLMRERQEQERLAAEEIDFERIMGWGLGPMDALDEQQEEVREATEWTRWQEADKWSWDEAKRQRWAEGLWRHQQKRRIERAALRRKLEAAEARQKLEAQFEARRRARWGQSSHHTAWQAGQGAAVGSAGYGGGRRDFLGYYAMLGLDVEASAAVSEGDVKRAFRQAALRWHPDRQKTADEQGRRKAQERFQQLKTAYEVLRNPELRREYDSGRMAEAA
ncbi:probable chaperone protein DnaJ at C-terminar half [Coccomyxa sp. Obi]|nr:probable chaperone protein DnaJ at C-terminar half [Coccomyxa sp. Obi]